MKAILKYLIFAIILNIVPFNFVYAQFTFGIKGGLNFGSGSFDPELTDTDIGSRTGLTTGLFVGVKFGVFQIQPEIYYSQKGIKTEKTIAGILSTTTHKFDYLEIPVLIKYLIIFPGAVTPSIYAGPSIGLLLGSKTLSEAGGTEVEVDTKDVTKSTEFGLVFGLDLKINAGKIIVFLDGKYNLGFSDLNNDPNYTTKIKLNTISALLGIGFPLK